jgi:hypothetical protein
MRTNVLYICKQSEKLALRGGCYLKPMAICCQGEQVVPPASTIHRYSFRGTLPTIESRQKCSSGLAVVESGAGPYPTFPGAGLPATGSRSCTLFMEYRSSGASQSLVESFWAQYQRACRGTDCSRTEVATENVQHTAEAWVKKSSAIGLCIADERTIRSIEVMTFVL